MNLHKSMVRESTVEDACASAFGAVRFVCLNGAALDDAGERSGPDSVILPQRLAAAIQRFNPALPPDTVAQIVRLVQRPPHLTLIENNRWLYGLLTDGVEVEYRDAATGENRGGRARLVDFENPANNDFLVVRQLTVATTNGKLVRPDLVVYLNGLPLAVIELKDPADEGADLGTAIEQLGRYMRSRARPVCGKHDAGGERWAADSGGIDHERTTAFHAVASGDGGRADAGGADPGRVRAGSAAGLPALLRGV